MKKPFLSHSVFSKSLPQMTEDMKSWASCVLCKESLDFQVGIWSNSSYKQKFRRQSTHSLWQRNVPGLPRENCLCGRMGKPASKASSSMTATRVKVAVLERENTKGNSDYVQNCRTHLRKLNSWGKIVNKNCLAMRQYFQLLDVR